jgi:hypothetical protein
MSVKRKELYAKYINAPAFVQSIVLSINSTIYISNNRRGLKYRTERFVKYTSANILQWTKWLLCHFPIYKSKTNLSLYYCSTAKRILDTISLNTIQNSKLTATRTDSNFKHALSTKHLTRQLVMQLSQGTLIHNSHQSPTRTHIYNN